MSKARKKYQSRTTIKMYDALNAFNVTRDHFCRCHVLGVECKPWRIEKCVSRNGNNFFAPQQDSRICFLSFFQGRGN